MHTIYYKGIIDSARLAVAYSAKTHLAILKYSDATIPRMRLYGYLIKLPVFIYIRYVWPRSQWYFVVK